MPIPAKVTFEDDFIFPVLGPAWITSASGSGLISVAAGNNRPPGLCTLYTGGGIQGAARIHQGADGAVFPSGLANDAPAMDCRLWTPAKNVLIEARVYLNVATQDAGFTVGLVGPRDPENVLVAEYSGSWYLQAINNKHEAPPAQEATGFNHVPGGCLDIAIQSCPSEATLTINGMLLATVTDVSAIPVDPLCFEFQCWNRGSLPQVTMWCDWVKITQDR